MRDLEVNSRLVVDPSESQPLYAGRVRILVTPPLDEDFWLARVRVGKRQALVAFPKFGTVGIGFALEEDWNTNLPYTCCADEIYEHIKHNRGSKIPRKTCIEAIESLRSWAWEYDHRQEKS